MAHAALEVLQHARPVFAGGVIVAPELAPPPSPTISALRGDHPLPGRASFSAAARIGQTTAGMRGDDVVVVLISGGASSLIGAPLRGMGEAELVHLFELLLGSGLDIRSMNAVRKRFTRWGAGRLALALAPATSHVLILSDVPGDDPADVGSGPCTPDEMPVAEVSALLERAGLTQRLAPALQAYLRDVARGTMPETPRASHPAFAHVTSRVIGSNRLALDAIAALARTRSLAVEISSAQLGGDAAQCGAMVADQLLRRANAGMQGVVAWGGETTVTLDALAFSDVRQAPRAMPPKGGRCQELALSAARVLASGGDVARRVTLLAAGTDGRDGPTDAAGAYADAALWECIRRAGHDPGIALDRHESYTALDDAGALLRRGLTGTNVMDVVIGVVE